MKSQFDKWFEIQFGPRRIEFKEMTDCVLNDFRNNARMELGFAESELQHRNSWDAQKAAASYAKNAAPGFEF